VPTSSAINTSLPFKSGPKNASAHLMNLVSEKTHHTSARINGDGWTWSTIETPGLKEDSLFRSGRLTNAHPDEYPDSPDKTAGPADARIQAIRDVR
jgi:hypothetical protein